MSYEEWRAKYERELAENQRAWAEQRERIRTEYAGRYVGFAFGRVVAADADMDTVIAAMNALDPQAESGSVFRADEEPEFEIVESYSSEFLDG